MIVIGGGQAGLSVGYHLKRAGLDFVILDAGARIGDTWRQRWDSLRLFTPARYDGLDGMPLPGAAGRLPTKDEMADYLERYAAHFALPILHGVRVERLTREGDRYLVQAGAQEFEADARGRRDGELPGPQGPRVREGPRRPGSSSSTRASTRSLAQLKPGRRADRGRGQLRRRDRDRDGAATTRRGSPGATPARSRSAIEKPWVRRVSWRFVLPRRVPPHPHGEHADRAARCAPKLIPRAGRASGSGASDLDGAGVEWVARVAGVKDGLPVLADGRVLDVRERHLVHRLRPRALVDRPARSSTRTASRATTSGLVEGEPGLYFVGQHFQHAFSSTMIHGVGRDAARMVAAIRQRQKQA